MAEISIKCVLTLIELPLQKTTRLKTFIDCWNNQKRIPHIQRTSKELRQIMQNFSVSFNLHSLIPKEVSGRMNIQPSRELQLTAASRTRNYRSLYYREPIGTRVVFQLMPSNKILRSCMQHCCKWKFIMHSAFLRDTIMEMAMEKS